MKKWTVAKLNKDRAVAISTKHELPMLISMLLDIRGIVSDEDINDFLYNDSELTDPFEIKDMDKAVVRIKSAIENYEKICIYGDFDADGVTSTALLYSYLEAVGANVMFYIPAREGEGYGMNMEAVNLLCENEVKLIITVDNGIAAVDEIAYAKSLGIDTVITDHHMPNTELPDAVAIVDLHQDGCDSSFKELSGVGVALKLVMAIEGEYADPEQILENYSDLAALGTIGDIVPLISDNRVIVKNGLLHISNSDRCGINALVEESGLSNRKITTGNISFTLVPRINAGGRLGLSKKTVSMLLTDDEQQAYDIALELCEDNTQRQAIEKEILDDIDERIKRNPSIIQNRIIVVCGENWHQGVIGIVASRLKEAYGKPSIVISVDDDTCRASGRSVKGFSLCDAVFACSDLLTQFGGHPMAVGFGMKAENIDAFITAINDYAKSVEIPVPELELDCKLNPAQLSVSLADQLSLLEPFGAGNPTPLFGLYNMKLADIHEVGGGKHLKLTLTRGDSVVTAMRFSTSKEEFPYVVGDTLDCAVTLDKNIYNNIESLSVIIKELRFSDIDEEAILSSKETFEAFCRGDDISKDNAVSLLPSREEFALVYRYLRANGGYSYSVDSLLYRLSCDTLPFGRLRVILECMSELSLIEIYEGMNSSVIKLCDVEGKVNLDDSIIIKKLKEVSADA
ncbi:MAG: single-stranded-DNA-specific exonuclease RecJ [Ruminococcaceae bacterium]|nr:single-stranded-DNA-specific exonuclease RecJ [Oscillospiraceae bacterium]